MAVSIITKEQVEQMLEPYGLPVKSEQVEQMYRGIFHKCWKTNSDIVWSYTKEQVEQMYRGMFHKLWKTNSDIVWSYTRRMRNIGVMDKREFEEQCVGWNNMDDVRVDTINNRDFVIEGKKWYCLTVQVYRDNEFVEMDYDPCGLMLANYAISGYIYWFENERHRNAAVRRINRTCFECNINKHCKDSHYCEQCKIKFDAEAEECRRLRQLQIERQNAHREEIIADLLASEKKQPRKPSPPKKEECPLSPAELKAIPPRPPAKIRTPAGSLIDNKAKQVQWDNKYSIYKKWL